MWSRAILLVLLTAGCTRWRTPPLTPHQVIAATPHAKRIRVTLTDNSVLVLKDPVISGDSIAGKTSGMRISVPCERIAHTAVPVRPEGTPGLLSSWRTQRGAPQQVISEKQPERVRLTLTDSSARVVEHPVILGDSVIGLVYGTRTAVASARIARTEIRVENPWKMLAFVSLYAMLRVAGCRDSPDCPDR
jgi:hypothetical protein